LREAAEKLGKSKRTVQRLVKKWEEEGLAGLIQIKGSDRGSHRINNELEQFIIKTYLDENKGSNGITPNEVFWRTMTKLKN
jgi:putative transposase